MSKIYSTCASNSWYRKHDIDLGLLVTSEDLWILFLSMVGVSHMILELIMLHICTDFAPGTDVYLRLPKLVSE